MSNKKKSLYVNFSTTAGTAHFSWLSKPDTGAEFSDGKYKVTMSFSKDDPVVEKLNAVVADAAEREWGNNMPANWHNPIKCGDSSGKEQYAGRVFFTIKSTRAPTLVDAKNNALPASVLIMSGDTCRVAGAAKAYAGSQKGVSLYLDMVKLIQKNNSGASGGPATATSVFGEDEGYTAAEAGTEVFEAPVVNTGSAIDIDDL